MSNNSQNIRLTKHLLVKLLQTRDAQLFTTYSKLKMMYVGGIILNYKSRRDELSKIIGLSTSSLYRKLREMEEKGWIERSGGHIHLRSIKKICKLYGFSSTVIKKSYKLNKEIVIRSRRYSVPGNNVDAFSKYVVIGNQFSKQERVRDQKIMLKIGSHVSEDTNVKFEHLSAPRKRKLEKMFKLQKDVLIKELRRTNSRDKTINFEANYDQQINTYISLSRAGISNITGFKSKSTGTNIIKKLKLCGFVIRDKPLYTRLCKISFDAFCHLRCSGVFDNSCFWKNGYASRREINDVKLLDLETFCETETLHNVVV